MHIFLFWKLDIISPIKLCKFWNEGICKERKTVSQSKSCKYPVVKSIFKSLWLNCNSFFSNWSFDNLARCAKLICLKYFNEHVSSASYTIMRQNRLNLVNEIKNEYCFSKLRLLCFWVKTESLS